MKTAPSITITKPNDSSVKINFHRWIITGTGQQDFMTAFELGWRESLAAAALGGKVTRFVLALGEEIGTCASVQILREAVIAFADPCTDIAAFDAQVAATAVRILT